MDDFKKKVGKDIKRNIDSVRNMRGKGFCDRMMLKGGEERQNYLV